MDLSEISFQGLMIAEVKDNIDPKGEGRIKVFVPKIMFESEFGEKPYDYEYEIDDKNIIMKGKEDKNSTIKSSNGIWVRPTYYLDDNIPSYAYSHRDVNGGSLRIPRINSKIFVFFLDEDPQKGYYLPLSPSVLGEKISSDNASRNWSNINKRQNIDVVRAYWNGNRIEVDTNPDTNSFDITITDDPYNINGSENPYKIHVECNSNKKLIRIQTVNGNYVEIDDTGNKNELTAYAKGSINLKSDHTVNIISKGDINLQAGGTVNVI